MAAVASEEPFEAHRWPSLYGRRPGDGRQPPWLARPAFNASRPGQLSMRRAWMFLLLRCGGRWRPSWCDGCADAGSPLRMAI